MMMAYGRRRSSARPEHKGSRSATTTAQKNERPCHHHRERLRCWCCHRAASLPTATRPSKISRLCVEPSSLRKTGVLWPNFGLALLSSSLSSVITHIQAFSFGTRCGERPPSAPRRRHTGSTGTGPWTAMAAAQSPKIPPHINGRGESRVRQGRAARAPGPFDRVAGAPISASPLSVCFLFSSCPFPSLLSLVSCLPAPLLPTPLLLPPLQ